MTSQTPLAPRVAASRAGPDNALERTGASWPRGKSKRKIIEELRDGTLSGRAASSILPRPYVHHFAEGTP
jgi:hypothetical protein